MYFCGANIWNNNPMAIYLTIALIILLIAILIAYNSIIYRKNQVDNAFAGIDTMLKKRYELIPALTETVKAYMSHEKELLEGVTRLRNLYLSENQQSGKIEFADQLARQVGELFVQVENYPQLKAGKNFLKLQAAWNEMEDQIAAARRFYNSSVNDYHNSLEMFPTNIIARLMGMRKKSYFSIRDGEKEIPSE